MPDSWSQTDNVAWKILIPGQGWSSPIVWDDLVVVTSVLSDDHGVAPQIGLYDGHTGGGKPTTEHRLMLCGIDFVDGTIRWEREIHRAISAFGKHGKNSFATETPVTDGIRIYAYFGSVGVFAMDMNGEPLWSVPMEPVPVHGWGSAASPVLHEDRLYVVNDNDVQSGTQIQVDVAQPVVVRVPRG